LEVFVLDIFSLKLLKLLLFVGSSNSYLLRVVAGFLEKKSSSCPVIKFKLSKLFVKLFYLLELSSNGFSIVFIGS
jgi:hypothetical protein